MGSPRAGGALPHSRACCAGQSHDLGNRCLGFSPGQAFLLLVLWKVEKHLLWELGTPQDQDDSRACLGPGGPKPTAGLNMVSFTKQSCGSYLSGVAAFHRNCQAQGLGTGRGRPLSCGPKLEWEGGASGSGGKNTGWDPLGPREVTEFRGIGTGTQETCSIN